VIAFAQTAIGEGEVGMRFRPVGTMLDAAFEGFGGAAEIVAVQAEIAQAEAAIKESILTTGASAHGAYLQALIIAPRVTWDNKGMATYAALHPDVLAYRKAGEPSVQIRARSLKA